MKRMRAEEMPPGSNNVVEFRKMGKDMHVEIGETLSSDDLKVAGKRAELMQFLKEKTYGLAGEGMAEKYRVAEEKFQAKKPKAFQ